MYLVYSDNSRDQPYIIPIQRLSPDSRTVLRYVVQPGSDYPLQVRVDWDVTPWGTVYALLEGFHHQPRQQHELPDQLIARFKEDGTVDSVTKLEQTKDGFVSPERFAAFPGGFLITGVLALDPAQQQRRPFTGIYDQKGQFVREVRISDYLKLASKSGGTGVRTGEEDVTQETVSKALWAADQGKVIAAPDGNVYSLRATVPPVLYKISPGGEVLKEVKVQLNSPGLTPIAMGLTAQGGALMEFAHMTTANPIEDSKYQTLLAMVDLDTGEVTDAFRLPADHHVLASACVTPQGQFLFLGTSDAGTLDLVKFAAQ
ncbi:MAG: hypothetical protein ACLQVL_37075 [Terriglobia bacterium]